MRSAALFTLLLSSLCAVAFGYGWSKEDHEIFRIRDELELNEGDGVTFYDFVGVKNGPAASLDDINKAYRKTSARMHPDKVKPSKTLSRTQQAAIRKKASERFARLGLIANILRGPERDRYDHFLKNGFPKWRGTGYYYARFRPSIGSVLFGVFLVAGGAHYLVLSLTAKRQRDFMQTIIREARQAAFGAAGIPGIDDALAGSGEEKAGKKDRRRKGEAGSGSGTPQNRRKVTQPNGKSFVVDPNGDVFLLAESEDGVEELLLDPSEIRGARWNDTLVVGLPRGVYNLTLGCIFGRIGKKEVGAEEGEIEEIEEEIETGVPAAAAAPKKKGVAKKITRASDGMPRRRVKGRTPSKAQ